jgi:hypothetical protein
MQKLTKGEGKKMIHVLDGPETKTDKMIMIVTRYYKELFRGETRPGIRLKPDFFSNEEKIRPEENILLESKFSEVEIKEAIFSSYADGATSPDGLSFMFYQCFWDIIKYDLISLFEDWFEGNLDIFRLNFAMITLIRKENDAREMRKFRPVSLLNYSFKIFTKVLTNRFARILDRLISYQQSSFSYQQSSFIKGRFILESVVTTHEIIHEVHRRKDQGLVFKIDYEKAYDRVNLDLLYEILACRGFGPKIIQMIKQVTQEGSVGVKINDVEGDFFLTGKGLRHGDPLAPLLFNFVVDIFSRMIKKGSSCGIIRGMCTHLVRGGS